jgi:hypothetical protein
LVCTWVHCNYLIIARFDKLNERIFPWTCRRGYSLS